MKANQRTVKVYDSTHAIASRLSFRHGVSMTALIELALRRLAANGVGSLRAVDSRCRKLNARSVLAGVAE